MKTLVAYFSASGNTASLAKRVAEAAKAESEKGPEEPKPKKQKQRHVGLP